MRGDPSSGKGHKGNVLLRRGSYQTERGWLDKNLHIIYREFRGASRE